MAEEREYEVTVLVREDVITYPRIGEPVVTKMTTYVAAGLPPNTISIPTEKWSLEEEKRVIKEDIKRRLKVKPEVYKV